MIKHQTFIFLLFIFYIVAMTALMVWQGIGIAPDRYALVLLLGSLLIKRTRSFLMDWIPFLFLLIAYDFLRGFADNVTGAVNYLPMIRAENLLFGGLPTLSLQQAFLNTTNLAWYDYFFTIFYFMHFALPLSFGFLLWLYNRSNFRQFIASISLLSYVSWFTYIIFPAAPPWLANKEGYISGVTKIMDLTLQAFPEKLSLPTIYHNFNPNPVAAIPSLHAAYPFLVLLFMARAFRWKAIFFLPYVLSVWFSIVYLGEHYVVDILAGVAYAAIFYLITVYLLPKIKWNPLLEKMPLKVSALSKKLTN